MADKKISELTGYTPAVDTDVIPIVDTTLATTKKITWANIKATLKTYFDTLYPAETVTTIKSALGITTLSGSNTGDNATNTQYSGLAASKADVLSGTINEIAYFASATTIGSLAVATYPSLTELTYLKGVTSAIQTQLNAKGAGTVTAVSIVTANGVSGSSSGGATPALTITLGAITPTTVNTLTVGLGTNSLATNTALGVNALAGNNSSSGRNVATGYNSLQDNTTGIGNVATGYLALGNATTGSYNTAIGYQTFSQQIVTGSYNTAIGREALAELTSGSYNTAIGYYALGSGNTGSNNVAIGQYAGAYETSSDAFYVDNKNRVNTAGDKAGALLYGVFNATPSSQTLTINAAVNALVSYSVAGTKVVGAQVAAIGLNADTDANKITAIIAALRSHGLLGANA